ncbi:MAG: hypothetical protein N4A44_01420 [Alphaproteobacteria bacterium]|jgi:hypothetical protein|nr:hypothetical protein [Alphaproteobacteria bacterium]
MLKKSLKLLVLAVFTVFIFQTSNAIAGYGAWSACNCSGDTSNPKTDGIQTRSKSGGSCAARSGDVGECERVCVCDIRPGYVAEWKTFDKNSNNKADFTE